MPDNLPKLNPSTIARMQAADMGGMIEQVRRDLAELATEVGVPADSDEDIIRAAALKANGGAA